MKVLSSFRESEAGLELFFEMNELPTRINVIEEKKKKYWRFKKQQQFTTTSVHTLARCVGFCFCFVLFLFVCLRERHRHRER